MIDDGKAMDLTAAEMRQRLAFSTVAFPGAQRLGAREIAMVREAGITRMEICGLHPPTHYDYHDAAQVSEITAACREQGVAIVAIHGPNLPYDCPYEEVRRAVAKEAVVSARVAVEIGAPLYVGHFQMSDRSERTVREMLEHFDDAAIVFAVENLPRTPDIREYLAFVDRIGCDNFRLAVDIGHPRDEDGVNPFIKKGRAREAMAQCGGRLAHVHLHDFVETDHYPPFDGYIEWGEVFLALQDIGYAGEFVFESACPVSLEDTLQKIAAFPEGFVRRYGGQ